MTSPTDKKQRLTITPESLADATGPMAVPACSYPTCGCAWTLEECLEPARDSGNASGDNEQRCDSGEEVIKGTHGTEHSTPQSASRDTDTPRCNGLESQPVQLIDAWRSLARQLERELAEARAEALRWENLYGDEVSRSAEMAQQLRAEAPLSHALPINEAGESFDGQVEMQERIDQLERDLADSRERCVLWSQKCESLRSSTAASKGAWVCSCGETDPGECANDRNKCYGRRVSTPLTDALQDAWQGGANMTPAEWAQKALALCRSLEAPSASTPRKDNGRWDHNASRDGSSESL